MESNLKSLLWAVQAMGDLRYKKILFEASSVEVRQALLNPLRFPDLSPLILKILEFLHRFEKWTISHVSDLKNRVAKSIAESSGGARNIFDWVGSPDPTLSSLPPPLAESVVVGIRTQSYVASGGPRWLHQMLQEDASNTCRLVR
ncbi:hypothetical protein YC2023_073328 [Brassica napus]